MKDDSAKSSEPQASSAVDPLSVTIIGSFDELAAVAEEWDNFVERSGSDIYFVTDWLEAWWTYYGKNRTLRCFLIRKNGATVAAVNAGWKLTHLWSAPLLMDRFRRRFWSGAGCCVPRTVWG